jgi:endonuclease YncB( thermonuclease family)
MRPPAVPLTVPARPEPGAIEVPVLNVFDGDGFLTRICPPDVQSDLFRPPEVEIGVRFGFIDAPEIDQPGGIEARDFLDSLIGGRTVWLNVLVKSSTGRIADRYGRLIAVPFVEPRRDDRKTVIHHVRRNLARRLGVPRAGTRNVELEMVVNGWAWVLERYGPDDIYLHALEDARSNGRGLWSKKGAIPPWVHKMRKADQSQQGSRMVEPGQCPGQDCDGTLVPRTGRFGPFLGCSNFPRCRTSRTI